MSDLTPAQTKLRAKMQKPTRREVIRAMAMAMRDEQNERREANLAKREALLGELRLRIIPVLQTSGVFTQVDTRWVEEDESTEVLSAIVYLPRNDPQAAALLKEFQEIENAPVPCVASLDDLERRLLEAQKDAAHKALLADPETRSQLLDGARALLGKRQTLDV
ncbi:MAG: hypothetical protein J0L84_02145 [Verrucomicrobia bacterium]|nr:hypothetical protein [Verrucomicrobiota bacterium]